MHKHPKCILDRKQQITNNKIRAIDLLRWDKIKLVITEEKFEPITGKFQVNGRDAHCMQAGQSKPKGPQGGQSGGGRDSGDKDKRTLFVKGLPWSAGKEEIKELLGCDDARLLLNEEGRN